MKDDPETLLLRARDAAQQRRPLEALIAYDRIVELGVADEVVWRELAAVLMIGGEYAQARGAFEESLKRDPENFQTLNDLARVFYNLGDMDQAVSSLRRAIALGDHPLCWLNLSVVLPGAPKATPTEVRSVRETCARRSGGTQEEGRHGERRLLRPDRPIRVGYLSAYFHAANYMKPVWGLINHHDRERFEVVLLSDSALEKGMPGYRSDSRDQIVPTASLDVAQLRTRIEELQLDLLVELNAYSVPERLPVFHRSLSPVTLTWFNSYATTGLPGIEYIVGDNEVVRTEEYGLFSETVLTLPLSYLTFEVGHPAPPVAPPPCIKNAGLTFGSLVTQYKITSPVLNAWAEILLEAPTSRLLLAGTFLKQPENRNYVLAQFAARGISAERLQLLGPAEHYKYLQYYDQIDVALDAFPYNGGTTTMEAMWQGVPVLTFDGDRWASRTSQSLIRRTPWSGDVAADVGGYVDQAIALANSAATPDRLSQRRKTMREELAASSACDAPRLAREMESLYKQVLAD